PRKRNASAVSAPRAEAGGGALLDRSGELRIRFLAAVDHSAGFRGIYIEGHFAVGVAIRRGNDSDLVHGQVIGPPPRTQAAYRCALDSGRYLFRTHDHSGSAIRTHYDVALLDGLDDVGLGAFFLGAADDYTWGISRGCVGRLH